MIQMIQLHYLVDSGHCSAPIGDAEVLGVMYDSAPGLIVRGGCMGGLRNFFVARPGDVIPDTYQYVGCWLDHFVFEVL